MLTKRSRNLKVRFDTLRHHFYFPQSETLGFLSLVILDHFVGIFVLFWAGRNAVLVVLPGIHHPSLPVAVRGCRQKRSSVLQLVEIAQKFELVFRALALAVCSDAWCS